MLSLRNKLQTFSHQQFRFVSYKFNLWQLKRTTWYLHGFNLRATSCLCTIRLGHSPHNFDSTYNHACCISFLR